MNAAARCRGSGVVAGRAELLRGGRGREGEGAALGTRGLGVWLMFPPR